MSIKILEKDFFLKIKSSKDFDKIIDDILNCKYDNVLLFGYHKSDFLYDNQNYSSLEVGFCDPQATTIREALTYQLLLKSHGELTIKIYTTIYSIDKKIIFSKKINILDKEEKKEIKTIENWSGNIYSNVDEENIETFIDIDV